MIPLVNEYQAYTPEALRIVTDFERLIAPYIKPLILNGEYSAREIHGLLVEGLGGIVSEYALIYGMNKRRAQEGKPPIPHPGF